MTDRVLLSFDSGVAVLTLNRPDKHNGVDEPLLRGVVAAQRTLKKRRDVRVVITKGAGPSFCAGIDAKAIFGRPLRAALLVAQLWSLSRERQYQRRVVGRPNQKAALAISQKRGADTDATLSYQTRSIES
ncbi:MAG: hypothetical protein RLZZ450_1227 [Pseudomonadota bacterium]|jgi:enoyl-CoA hydratase/carnithine racemase